MSFFPFSKWHIVYCFQMIFMIILHFHLWLLYWVNAKSLLDCVSMSWIFIIGWKSCWMCGQCRSAFWIYFLNKNMKYNLKRVVTLNLKGLWCIKGNFRIFLWQLFLLKPSKMSLLNGLARLIMLIHRSQGLVWCVGPSCTDNGEVVYIR